MLGGTSTLVGWGGGVGKEKEGLSFHHHRENLKM